MAKIGVTGASGFIGNHLVRKLLGAGETVVALGRNPASPSIFECTKYPNFRFVRGDVSNRTDVLDAFSGVSTIYHLASSAPVYRAHMIPVEALVINAVGTANVLEAGRFNGNTRIIIASSGAVYANQADADESQQGSPNSFYGASKLAAERYALLYAEHYRVSCAILRMARVYGPGVTRGIIYDIISAYLEDRPIQLYLHPNSELDLIYVDDVTDAFLTASATEWPAKPVNISTGKGTKVAEIVAEVAKLVGYSLPIELRIEDQIRDVLANRQAINLGWKPRTPLREGLDQTIKSIPQLNQRVASEGRSNR